MIYVYTSVVNGFDNLRTPCVGPFDNVRFICFTNVPNLPRVYPWEYRPSYDVGNPARTSRVAKILPHLMLPEDAEYSIYHDGNFQLKVDPNRIIDMFGHHQWAAHKHPGRDCIYDEARIVVRDCPLVEPESVNRQIAEYRASGYPEHAGLWANGFIVRRHTPEVAALNELWWKYFVAGSERDQLSFPVAHQASGLEIKTIHENVFDSPYLQHRWHAAWRHKDDNPDYWPQRDRMRERLKKLAEVTGTNAGVSFVNY